MEISSSAEVFDVIVVGCGIAGSTCAATLLENNPKLKVKVLEARNRVGGRIFTEKIKDFEYDLGGQWISKHHKNMTKMGTKII